MRRSSRGQFSLAPFLWLALVLLAVTVGGCGWPSHAPQRPSAGSGFSLGEWFSAAPADEVKDAHLRALETQKQALEAENRKLTSRLSALEADRDRAERELAAADEE